MYHDGSGTRPGMLPLSIAIMMAVGIAAGLTFLNPFWWLRKSYYDRGWEDPRK